MRVDPWVEVRSVRALGESALVEVNVTAPGTLLCAYHAASIRPAFVDRPVRHAGAARVLLGGLQPATRYTVECSLNAGNRTVQSAGKSFESGEAAARLTITDVEPFATFARIRVKSDTPGDALCLPQRTRFGQPSLAAFARLAKRFHVVEGRKRDG